jgi:histidyl-tRNA synthetase
METSERSFKKAISSAVGIGCTHLIMIGEEEMSRGIVTIKDLRTKEQKEVPPEEVISNLD